MFNCQISDGPELANPNAYHTGQEDEQVWEKVPKKGNCVNLRLTTRPRTWHALQELAEGRTFLTWKGMSDGNG